LLSSNISSRCPHNMVNFSLLAAEIVSLVWGTPANFNGFRVLAALLHGPLVVGVSQTVAFNRGRHLYSAGRPSGWLKFITSLVAVFLDFCSFLIFPRLYRHHTEFAYSKCGRTIDLRNNIKLDSSMCIKFRLMITQDTMCLIYFLSHMINL